MRPRYSDAVAGETPQLRAMARPLRPASNFNRIISLSFRTGSLSAAISPPPSRGAASGGKLPSDVNAPVRSLLSLHLVIRSAIGMLRNW